MEATDFLLRVALTGAIVWFLGIMSAFTWWLYTNGKDVDNKVAIAIRWIGGLTATISMFLAVLIRIWS